MSESDVFEVILPHWYTFDDMDRLLSLQEIAQILRVSRSKVYLLISEQKLSAVYVGGSRRVLSSELERFLSSLSDKKEDSCS